MCFMSLTILLLWQLFEAFILLLNIYTCRCFPFDEIFKKQSYLFANEDIWPHFFVV